MKNIKMLGVCLSLIFFGCSKTSAPPFPEGLKNFYVTFVKAAPKSEHFLESIKNIEAFTVVIQDLPEVSCIHFELANPTPWKINYIDVKPIGDCNLVGGFNDDDNIIFHNWTDDLWSWAKTKEQCLSQ